MEIVRSEPTRRELLTAFGTGAVAVATVGTAGSIPASSAPTGAWPSDGYDMANTAFNPDATGPGGDVGADWTFETAVSRNPFTGSVVVADGVVYAASPEGTLYALDGGTGTKQWELGFGAQIRVTPAIASGFCYIADEAGTVYGVSLANGDVEWTATADAAVRTSPAVSSGLVYVGSQDATIYAFDGETGEEEWTASAEAEVSASPAVGEETGLVYVGSDDGRLYALDAETGSREWAYRTDAGEPIRSAPTVADGRVYIGTGGSIDQQLYAIDSEGGFERWREPVGGTVVNSVAVTNDSVYVPVRDGTESRVVAFTPTGDEQWQFETNGIPTSPAVDASHVYVGSQNGSMYAIDAAGEERWTVETGTAIQSAPIVVDDRVFGANNAGLVFSLAEGGTAFDDLFSNGDDTDENGGISPGDFSFLLWPASVISLIGIVVGGYYAASRAGLLDRIEAAADAQTPTPEELRAARKETEAATPVWELVVKDVISRADMTDKTATENLLVTKYVDHGTLESPVVAYEIESYRDEPATVRLSEPLRGDRDESRPLGDNWRVVDDRLVFEAMIDPDETLRTLVGRPDCDPENVDKLLDTPDISVRDTEF